MPDPLASPRVSDEDLAMWVEALAPEINYVHTNGTVGSAMARTILDLRDCRAELAAVRARQQRLIDLAREVAEDVETLANAWLDKADEDTLGDRIGILNVHADWMWEYALTLAASQPEEAGRE